jgi:hypothetical protein
MPAVVQLFLLLTAFSALVSSKPIPSLTVPIVCNKCSGHASPQGHGFHPVRILSPKSASTRSRLRTTVLVGKSGSSSRRTILQMGHSSLTSTNRDWEARPPLTLLIIRTLLGRISRTKRFIARSCATSSRMRSTRMEDPRIRSRTTIPVGVLCKGLGRLLPSLVDEVDKTESEGGGRVIRMSNRSFLFGSVWLVLSTTLTLDIKGNLHRPGNLPVALWCGWEGAWGLGGFRRSDGCMTFP